MANCLLYGAYIAISKDLFKRYGALNVITWMFCIGSLVILPVGAYAVSGDKLQTLPESVWLAVIYIILVPTLAAYYLNAWALTRVSPSTLTEILLSCLSNVSPGKTLEDFFGVDGLVFQQQGNESGNRFLFCSYYIARPFQLLTDNFSGGILDAVQ